MQIPFPFENEGQQISATLHVPEGVAKKVPGVLLCHGFTGQRTETHRLFVAMSRELEKRGIASLRFDFRGSGESEGSFADMTVSGEISDAQAAFDRLASQRKVHPKRLGVLGLSLGGCVAACLAGREKRVASLALWSAVADPAGLILGRMAPREKRLLARKGYLDRGGMPVGKGFYRELPSIRPLDEIAKAACPVLVVHGTKDAAVPLDHAKDYLKALKARRAPAEKLILRGADHVYSSVEWTEKVVRRTSDWFARTLR